MNSKKSCRLCGDFIEDVVDIFQEFEDSTVAAIITQHFSVQVCKDDGSSDCLCQTCWTNTKKFHIFYKNMESLQKNHFKSIDFVEQHTFDSHGNQTANNSSNIVIKREPSLSPIDIVEETKGVIVKTEEIDPLIALDLIIQREEEKGEREEKSEGNQRSENENRYQKVNEKAQNNGVCESKNTKLDDADNSSHRRSNARRRNRRKKVQTITSRRDTATEDAQIRDFCNMKCEICCERFETFAEAKTHYRICHGTDGYVTCCRLKFFRRYSALRHIQLHLNPKKFECDMCGNFYADKSSLKTHLENHGPRAHKCDICSSSFTREWKLANHKRRQHCSEEDKKFHCDQCNKKFVSKSVLTYHIRSEHELAYARVCDICAKVYKHNTNFLRHMQTHSTVPQPKLQCNVCGKWMKNKGSLQNHLKLHQDTSSTAVCTICKKVLATKSSLITHMHGSHGERSHKCTVCNKAFTRAGALKEHMDVHIGELQYKCQYCERDATPFKTKANVIYHQKKVHFEELKRDRLKRLNSAVD